MVLLYRSRMLVDLLLSVPLMICYLVIALAAVTGLSGLIPDPRAFIVLWIALMLLAVAGFAFLLPRSGGSVVPWGPETPPGERWEISGPAQLPGTRLTGIQLALRVIDEVPPAGAVIVAIANSTQLFHQYQQFGFTAGPKHRVHKIIA